MVGAFCVKSKSENSSMMLRTCSSRKLFPEMKLREDAVAERIRTTATQAKKTPLRASPRGGCQLASLDEVNAQHVKRRRVCINTMLRSGGRDTKRLSSTPAVTGRRRKIVHLKTPDFAAPVHGFVRRPSAWILRCAMQQVLAQKQVRVFVEPVQVVTVWS